MSFAAGFAQGFADTFVGRLEDRRKRVDELVDQGIKTAKAVAPRYAQTQAEYKNMLEIGDRLKARYNVSDEEFVALAQGTDVTALYESILKEDAQRTTAGRSKLRKEDFISVVDLPETVLSEGMTRESALAQIMGLQRMALENEPDPKSEGAKTRSGAKALSEFLAYNPDLNAEQQLEAMKVMGYDVADLEYFQATQGMKQTVIPGVTRTRDVLFDDINYDESTYDSTKRKFNSMLSTRLAGADISNPDIFRTTTGIEPDNKVAMRDVAMRGSLAMSKLELQIVNSGAGLGLIGPAARRELLEGIYDQIDGGNAGMQELQTLIQSVDSGSAMSVISSIYNSKGRFDPTDIDAIIKGVNVESSEGGPTEEALTDADMGLPTEPVALGEQPEKAEQPAGEQGLLDRIDKEQNPIVKKALQKELEKMRLSKEEEAEDGPALTTPEFIMEYDQTIINALQEAGLTAEDDEDEFKRGLADWFSDNEGRLGSFVLDADTNLDMLAKVFRQTFINLADQ